MLTLAPGRATLVTFTVDTGGIDPGNYTYGVYSGADSRLEGVRITASADTHPSGVSRAVFDAVAGADGDLDRGDVVTLVGRFVRGQSVGGVKVTRSDVVKLVRFFIRE